MTARLRAPAALLAIAMSALAGCQDMNGPCPGNRSACAVFFESAEDCGEVQRIDFEITQEDEGRSSLARSADSECVVLFSTELPEGFSVAEAEWCTLNLMTEPGVCPGEWDR